VDRSDLPDERSRACRPLYLGVGDDFASSALLADIPRAVAVRLLALDADGTLLDSRGEIRPAVRTAVGAARERGVMVVLCTGRRYRTALPLCRELDLKGPQVVQNGVLVKDARSGDTLASRYLAAGLYQEALALMRSVGPPLVYIDHVQSDVDIVCEPADRAHPFQAEYLNDNTSVTRAIHSLDHPPEEPVVMLSCMADEAALRRLRERVGAKLGDRVRTNFLMNKNYRGHILEIVSSDSGKWAALAEVAQQHGIPTESILAIGDDENDAEMIEKAGIGVAMGNAIQSVLEVADHTTQSSDEDGVAQAIERFILSA
jgi:Cof subfamily protein (haloacid dehalogenase superfamily)